MSRRKIIVIAVLAGIALAGLAAAAGTAYTPPILMYHSIDPSAPKSNRLAVHPDSFDRQMRLLRFLRYRIVTVEELAGMISRGERIPARTVAITFDDGYRNNYTYAFPVLKKYRVPVTLFVIVDEVGRSQNDRLWWSEILQMQGSGLVHVGSHCLGPDPLIKLSDDEVVRQVRESRIQLQERLGRPVAVFSYPEGMYNERIKDIVKEAGYAAAVATNPGRRSRRDDVFALKRLRIGPSSDNLFVFLLESSGFYTFIKEHRRK